MSGASASIPPLLIPMYVFSPLCHDNLSHPPPLPHSLSLTLRVHLLPPKLSSNCVSRLHKYCNRFSASPHPTHSLVGPTDKLMIRRRTEKSLSLWRFGPPAQMDAWASTIWPFLLHVIQRHVWKVVHRAAWFASFYFSGLTLRVTVGYCRYSNPRNSVQTPSRQSAQIM